MIPKRKIAVVTGGSRGLGKNISLSLAEAGNDVIITYNQRKEEALAVVDLINQTEMKAVALQLNTGDISGLDKFKEEIREILMSNWQRESFDFLINNAGIDSTSPFDQTTEEQFDNLLNVHFKGVYFLTQKLLPMINNSGSIINISTGLSRFVIPGYSAYASMKGAIEVFTKYLAKEVGERRIRVNVVAPGAIDTDFNKAAFEHFPGMKDFIASQTALGRVGVPEDIGSIIAFLCSDSAGWITAQRIEASGGMFL